jgi:hypothetical protein
VAGEADAVDRLLPAFIRLTKDDIYRVRKACAEALVDMSAAVSPGLRGHVLLEVFTRLAGDASKLVRQAAMQQLGPFLSTLPAAKVSDALLEMFAGMAAADTGDPTLDRDMRGYCAYNLPGVMAAVGPSRWRPFLKEAYGRLVRDGVWTVRRTLACSLHEMVRVMGGRGPGPEGGPGKKMEGRRGSGEEGGLAGDAERLEVCGADREWREKGGSTEPMQGGEPWAGGPGDEEDEKGKGVESEVGGRAEGRDGGDEDLMQCPGPERVERELVFALDAFLQDVEDVRMGALQHLAATLAHLPPPSRQAYLPVLCELVTRTPAWQWRPRHALARQLPGLLPLYGGRALHAVFGPLAFALLEDPVAVVRAEAVPAFGPLYDAFSREERGEIGAAEGGAEKGEEEGEEEGGREALMGRLLTMAEAESYLRRQLFLRVALTLPSTSSTLPRPCFHRQLLPRLLRLAQDPVPNVRIVLARLVASLPVWALEESPPLQEALTNLLLDANRDVRLSMEHCRANRPELASLLSHPPASPPPPPPPPLPPSPSCLSPLSLTLKSGGRRRSFSTGEELPVLSPPPSLQAASLLDDIHATADPERIQAILSLAREKQAHEAAREEEEEEEEEDGQEGEDKGVLDGEKGGTARSTSLPTERGDASGVRAVMEGAVGGGGASRGVGVGDGKTRGEEGGGVASGGGGREEEEEAEEERVAIGTGGTGESRDEEGSRLSHVEEERANTEEC